MYENKTIDELIAESRSYDGSWVAKPRELLIENIRKLEKIRELDKISKLDNVNKLEKEGLKIPVGEVKDLSHRKFNLTLLPSQVLNSFKKSIRKGEYDKAELITVFRVIAQQVYNDPSLTDKDVVDMFNVTKVKAGEYYERRSKSINRRGK